MVQVIGRGVDGVRRVLWIADAITIGVDPEPSPRIGHELRPPDSARAGRTDISTEARLDAGQRREYRGTFAAEVIRRRGVVEQLDELWWDGIPVDFADAA